MLNNLAMATCMIEAVLSSLLLGCCQRTDARNGRSAELLHMVAILSQPWSYIHGNYLPAWPAEHALEGFSTS